MTSPHARAAALALALAAAPAAALAAPTAQCGLSLPSGPLLGAELGGTVTLTPTAEDPIGFQPAIELFLPPEVSYNAGSAVYEVGGSLIASAAITVPASGVVVNPYTRQAEDLVTPGLARPGDTYVLLRYPLSNLASTAPAARARFTLTQTGAAAAGTPFDVRARCLYLLGATPVNDVATDPPLATAGAASASVTPQLVRVEVAAANPRTGAHTVTGPTSPLDYTIRVYVAEGRTVEALTVTQDVDAKLQLVGTPSAPTAGAVSPAAEPVTQGGQVSATWASLTGPHGGPAATVTFRAYVAEFDDGDPGAPVLPADGRIGAAIGAQARIDTYTVGGVVLTTPLPSNVASVVPHGALLAETIAPDSSIPGQTATVTEEVLVSDYRSFAPGEGQGPNTLHLELGSGVQYGGATGAVSLPFTCDPGAAVAGGLVDAVVTAPATAPSPTAFDLVLPALPGAGAGAGPGAVTTACRVTLPVTVLSTYGDGGAPVFSSDVIPTQALLGTVVDDGGAGLAASQTEADSGIDDSFRIRSFQLSKALVGAPQYVNPGEAVEWRISGEVLGGATDTSDITDFLPAPIFDVAELGASGVVGAAGGGGAVRFDPTTSAYVQGLAIAYTTDARTNSITFSVPAFPFQGAAQRVAFLIGLTVRHEPADDRLTYVNLAAGTQHGTLTYRTSAAAAATFAVNEPEVTLHHGVTAALGAAAAPSYTPELPAYAAGAPGAANVWSSGALGAEPPSSSVAGVDAGDHLILAAVLENSGNAPAHGVTARVDVPAAYGSPSVISFTDGAGQPIPGATAVAAGGTISLFVPMLPAVDPDSGANVAVLRYGVPLAGGVQAQEALDPAVLSLLAYKSVEAEDAPSFVGTPPTAEVAAIIRDLSLTHGASWPSPAYPDGAHPAGQAAVGDVGRYTLAMEIPEGTQRALTLTEILPVGLALVPGSIAIAADSDFAAGDLSGGAPADATSDGFTWSLGTLANGSTDGVPRFLRVQYDALLQNLAGVQAGAALADSAATLSLGAPPAASSPPPTALTAAAASPDVVEPALALSTSFSPALPVPGGTTLTVQVTLRHAAGSTAAASDVAYALTLPAGSLSAPSGAAFTQDPAGCAGPTVSGQTVSFTCDALALGQQEVLTFQTTVPPGSTIASQFALSAVASPPTLTWTSVPAATRVAGAFVARTGSTADPGGPLNDYALQDATQIRVTPTTATKALVGAGTRTIGEWVDWDVTLAFPVGTTTSSMVDTLPSGLVFVGGTETSNLVNPDPGTLTWSNGGGAALPAATPSNAGGTATWDLGTITRLEGGSGALSFRVRARLASGVRGDVLAANTLTPPGGTPLSADRAITIVEPTLTATTTRAPTGNQDAGNVITWTTTIAHTAASNATAYDVLVRYPLNAKLTLDAPASTFTGCGAGVNPAVTAGTSGSSATADLTLDALPAGTTCVITFKTTLAASVNAGEALTSPAPTLRFRSLPDATAQGAERTYTPATSALATITVPAITVAKTPSAPSAAVIGQPVPYRITVTVPESSGTVTLQDQLPRGMQYVSSSLDFTAGDLSCAPTACALVTPTFSGAVGATTNQTATWSFGTLANTTGGATNGTRRFYVDVVARIVDLPEVGTTLTSFTNPARVNGGTWSNAGAVSLVHPSVAVALTPSTLTADAGDTVTWTAVLTGSDATAHGVAVHYAFPGHLGAGTGAVGACAGGTTPAVSVTSSGGATLVDLTLDSLAAASTCTFTFTTPLDPAVQAGEALAPLAGQTVSWRSQPSNPARTYQPALAAPATIRVPGIGIVKARTSAATAAVAEPVHYRLAVTLPETGGTPLTVVDTLPSGMELVGASLDLSGGGFTCAPAPCAAVAPVESGALGAGAHRVETWDFGTVATTGNAAGLGTRTFHVDVTARIADLAANGTTLATYVNAASAGGVDAAPPAAVGLVEPTVSVAVSPSTLTADAGDTVTWTATLTASGATAHDVVARYAFPGHLRAGAGAAGACAGGSGPAISVTSSGGDTLVDLTLASLAAASTCTFTFTTPLDPAVQAGEALAPLAGRSLTWNSQPHASAGGAERPYSATPAAPATVAVPALTLSKTRTSPAGAEVSVGDEVVYRVTVNVPEGRTPGVELVDTLPAGLRFVSARFVNPGGALECTPACADGAAAVPAVAGQVATFSLGQVEPAAAAATPRQHALVVEVTTAVEDVVRNGAGASIAANSAQARSALSGPVTATGGGPLTVAEPALAVTSLTTDAAEPDAGNTVTFTATLDSPALAHLSPAAYDVALRLALPGTLQPGTIDLSGCAGAASTAARQTFGVADGRTVVELVLDVLPLPAAGCALRFGVVLGPEVVAGETLAVDADPARSWLRYASAPAGGRSSTAEVPPHAFAAAPLRVSSALASAGRQPVGGRVRYDVTVHVPEGVSPVTVDEALPAGLAFRSASLTNAGGLACAPAACADGAPIAPAAMSGQQLTFDLGTVTNPGAAGTTERRDLVLHVVAAVADEAGNVAGAALPESLATVTGGASARADGVEVIEPALTAAVALEPAGAVDAGDAVAVATTVSNAWDGFGADAHDVDVVFALPPELEGQPGTVTASPGCALSADGTAVGAGALRVRLATLEAAPAPGTSTDCTVTAVLRPADAAAFGRTYAALEESALTWASTAGPNADRRDGSLALPFDDYRAPLGFAVAMSSATAVEKAFVAGSSSSPDTAGEDLALGETATYRLRVTLPEGTTPGVVVTDTPPPGLRLVAVAPDPDPLQGCTAPTCRFGDPAATLDGASGEARAFDLGTVVIPGSDGAGRALSLLVTVQAVPDAALAPLSANAAALSADGAARPPAATAPVAIVRPAPAVTLALSDAAPEPGAVVHVTAAVENRGAGPACDPQLSIALPAALTPVPPGALTLSLPGTCIPAHGQRTLALDARVAADVPPEAITVSATLGAYRTLAGGGAVADPAADGLDNDLDGASDEAGDATATADLTPVAPRLRFTKAAAVAGGGPLRPGGELAYTLRVENLGSFPARAVVITDPLPLQNADLVAGSASATQGAVAVAAGTLTAALGDVAPGAPVEVEVRLRLEDPVITADPLVNQATLATADGYGGLRSDDPATPEADDPTVVPVARNGACAGDSDCLLAQWCDLEAHTCRPDLPHGGGACQPGAPHAGAQCNCDPNLPAAACLPPGVDACDPHDGACGLVNGTPCAGLGDAVCRSLVCNADGRCGDPDGAACDPDALPNLTCRSGVCDPQSRRCGLPAGEPCRAARECRSRTCGLDGRCGELNGTPCTDAAACRSAVCNADGHCGDPLGATCATGLTCRSNTCEAGRCVEPCAGDAACAAGFFCEPTAHLCRPARAAGEACQAGHAGRDCAAGACGADGLCGLGEGEACGAPDACRSGGCVAGRCGGCAADADCAPERHCGVERACAPRLDPGAACPPGAAGHRACRPGLCAADGRCGTPDGLACASAAECRSGVCSAAGVCAAEGCAADDDCLAGAYCDAGGRCAPRAGNGAPCDRAAMCHSAICEPDGTCGALDREPCDVLAPSPQCRGGACNPADDACGLTGGQACTAPVECRVGLCAEEDGQCGLPPGGACTADDACRSQTCLGGVCTVCTTDAACGPDAFCDFPAGQCAPKRPPLAPCERGAQCTRDVCGKAGVCLGGFQDGVGVSGSACSSAGDAPAWLALAALLVLVPRRRRRAR